MVPRLLSFRLSLRLLYLLAALLVSVGFGWFSVAQASDDSPAAIRLRNDVMFLADDAREGRAPGTAGIEAAANYIATMFNIAGLKPAPGAEGYFQPFEISGDARLGEPQRLAVAGPNGQALSAELKTDYTPLAIGIAGHLEKTPLVFAGYGITAKDQEAKLDYDDYADVDVKGKAVILLRKEPQQDQEDSPFGGKRQTSYAFFQHKISNAFQHGAAAVLLVNDAAGLKGGTKDTLIDFTAAGTSKISNLPVLMVKRSFIDRILAEAGVPALEDLEAQIDADLKPRSRVLDGWTLDATITIDRTPIRTKNVVGVLEGAGPFAEETVVLGAHYDHLGHGGMGSLAFLSREIHNGADDNASGTAMLLEMARRLGRRPDPLPRRVVFIAFSGEERGLLGSAHYVEHPLYPLDKTVMMVNFDMVGRLNDKNELTIYGTGTTPGLDALVEALGKTEGFVIKKIADGFGPSDQASFYGKGIPVLFTFTGTHKDYHRPSDDADRINYAGMARIADFAELLVLDLVRRPERPLFTKVERKRQGSDTGRVALSVYLGTIPEYDDSIQGVKLSGVREDSPADKGGLKGGDIIIGLGGKPIGTINDYMESLSRYKPGDSAEIVVKREGQEVTLKVTFGARPSE
jgi:hypothetical protein